MNGKSKCKILKDIRRQIAQDNDIEFITSECRYQGECSGTCPKCEAEVRYLEQELVKRQAAGKALAVAGIAAALVVGTTGCGMDINTVAGDLAPSVSTNQTDPTIAPTDANDYTGDEPLAGEPSPTTEPTWSQITGEIVIPDYTEPDDDDWLPGGAVPLEDCFQSDSDNDT